MNAICALWLLLDFERNSQSADQWKSAIFHLKFNYIHGAGIVFALFNELVGNVA